MPRAGKWLVKESLINYIWLAFWAVHVLYMLQAGLATGQVVVGLIAMLAFVLAFHFSMQAEQRTLIICIAAEIAIFLLLSFHLRISFIGLSLYPAVTLGQLNTTKQVLGGILAVIIAITLSMAALLGGFRNILTDLGTQTYTMLSWYLAICFTPFLFRVVMYWRETNRQLQAANEQIAVLTRVAERQRIARDLHDTLGHTFSMIALKSELAERLVSADPVRSQAEMQQVQRVARQALTEMRQLVAGLHHVSAQEELQNAQLLLRTAGIEVQVVQDDSATSELVGSELDDVLGNCLRELVTNVVKHSAASHCQIGLRRSAGGWELQVCDDGRGLTRAGSPGHGLDNLRERLARVQGSLELSAEPQRGTSITVRVAAGGMAE